MNHDAHTLREFDAALTSLNTHLLQMAYKAQSALDLAVSGLLQQDEDAANQAIADDEELDELEMAVDREGLHLLAFFSPVASDLRVVLASIRLSAIYERMGDESVTIAKRANKLNKRPRLREAGLVEPVYRELAEQFRAVNKAVSSWNAPALASLARGLASLAEKTGALTETFARLPEHYRDNLVSVADLIFIGRSLERITEGLQKVAAEALYGAGPRQP
ncbi:MAG: hypothetical protein LUE13_07600 [Akkermansiaceae bacterium]|nr:hypothetical protein [Akkermansiaceae bacterium]